MKLYVWDVFQNTLSGGGINERRKGRLMITVAGDTYLGLGYTILSSLCIFEIFHRKKVK